MLLFEVFLTALLVVGAVAAVIGWLTRPIWRAVLRRYRLEQEMETLHQQAKQDEHQRLAEAAEELKAWMKQAVEGRGAPSASTVKEMGNPVLRAVLERYPLDERVLEAARVYRQVTGKDLLPGVLTREASEAEVGAAEAPPAIHAADEEHRKDAAREVEEWAKSTGKTDPPQLEQENRA
jgi:hypothetical protein